jgi:drug/metabolite transporter (DMT)-like permease
MWLGIVAGLAAGALWGLTFVAPNLVSPFSPFDLALWRNVIFGVISAVLLWLFRARWRNLDRKGWQIALFLGLLGYSGYYLFVAYAVTFAGPALVALVIGSLPVLLAVVGNLRDRSMPWRLLVMPLLLIAAGIAVVNVSAMQEPVMGRQAGAVLFGFVLAIGGLLCWLIYGVINAEALRQRPGTDTTTWTSLQGVGAALGMLVVLPVGAAMGWSNLRPEMLAASAAGPLWFWAIVTGAFSSWIATFAWVLASRRLSVALSAQLIVSETVFGMFYGFIVESRWPVTAEIIGAALLFGGVTLGIRLFARAGAANAGNASAQNG